MPEELIPRLKWRRVRAGKYVSGPYLLHQHDRHRHRPIWELTLVNELTPLGHFHSARIAMHHAAEHYAASSAAFKNSYPAIRRRT